MLDRLWLVFGFRVWFSRRGDLPHLVQPGAPYDGIKGHRMIDYGEFCFHASGVDEDFRKDGAFDFQCDHQGIVVGHIEIYSFVPWKVTISPFGIVSLGVMMVESLIACREAHDRLSRVSIFLDVIGLIDLKRSRSIDSMQLDWIGMGSIVALRKLKSVS
ncbi:hypothetical protein DY000_02061489 [Brassica cretica]|uniref:Uncharacterized protein n=1 Tax=Brassica cretica TaxID=69181 RepID=A0ABQ7ASG4_BRACR|nr:hypothetical protein DY000_02061489 [Brassica cretica]